MYIIDICYNTLYHVEMNFVRKLHVRFLQIVNDICTLRDNDTQTGLFQIYITESCKN
jgi:hypothetical protein